MLTLLTLAAQLVVAAPVDTPPPRPRPRVKAVEVSDWYNRRLTIHRVGAYATLPLFGFQYLAGNQIWQKGKLAPAWARNGHRVGATTIATVFTINTVTGVWNLWDSRHTTAGRFLRYTHAFAMLAADAGFTYAGAVLSERAERDINARKQHRTLALTCMGVTVTSGLMMQFFNK